MPGDTIFKYSHLIRISDISQGVNHQELIGRKLFPQRLPSYCIFQDFARLFSCKDSVKWKITVDQNLCVEQKWISLVTALQFVCFSSFSTVKRKVDKENYLDAHYISSVYFHHPLHWVGPQWWQILMTCVQRRTAEPLWTMWRPTAVERTFSNVTNAKKT